jgi:hypothetical protein
MNRFYKLRFRPHVNTPLLNDQIYILCLCRRGANGAGRSGIDREGGLSAAGAGLLGETTAMFEDRISPAKHSARDQGNNAEHDTTILLVPRGPSMPRSTVSTQLVSEL